MKKPPSIADSDRTIYADFPRRTLAFAIDCMILSVPYLLLFLWVFPRLLNDDVMFWYYDSWLSTSWFSAFLGINMMAGLPLAAYSACFHASPMQATPGKRIMGIKVIDYQGRGIHFFHAFIRQLGLTAGGVPTLLIGLILVPFTQYRQGHHDVLCNTYVIDRHALDDTPEISRRLYPALTGSVLLLSALWVMGGYQLLKWAGNTWGHWKTANQVGIVLRHTQLVDVMLRLTESESSYYGSCFRGDEMDLVGEDEEDYKELILGSKKYFKNLMFSSAGRNKCQFAARLHVPWNEVLHNEKVKFSININPENPDIDCDPVFTSISWVCTVATLTPTRKDKEDR